MPQLDFLIYNNTLTRLGIWSLLVYFLIAFFLFFFYFFLLFNYLIKIKNFFNNNSHFKIFYFLLSTTSDCDLWFLNTDSENSLFYGDPVINVKTQSMEEWGHGLFIDQSLYWKASEIEGLENFSLIRNWSSISEVLESKRSFLPNMPSNLIGFQNPASLEMAAIICIHNDIYYYLQFILFTVSWFLFFSVFKFTKKDDYFPSKFKNNYNLNFSNYPEISKVESFDSCTLLEILWTIFPSFCLLLIGYPGISLLYSVDEQVHSDFFVKIIGHQWYWTYEYPEIMYSDNRCFKYDSVLRDWNYYDLELTFNFEGDTTTIENSTESLKWLSRFYNYPEYNKKYIYVNAPLYIIHNMPVTAIVTSSDVLHSWAVPVLGVKIDACPGRLNQVQFEANLKTPDSPFFGDTYFWGQCSEFCGIGHGFMPILVRSSSLYDYFDNIISEFKVHEVMKYKKGMFGDYPSYLKLNKILNSPDTDLVESTTPRLTSVEADKLETPLHSQSLRETDMYKKISDQIRKSIPNLTESGSSELDSFEPTPPKYKSFKRSVFDESGSSEAWFKFYRDKGVYSEDDITRMLMHNIYLSGYPEAFECYEKLLQENEGNPNVSVTDIFLKCAPPEVVQCPYI